MVVERNLAYRQVKQILRRSPGLLRDRDALRWRTAEVGTFSVSFPKELAGFADETQMVSNPGDTPQNSEFRILNEPSLNITLLNDLNSLKGFKRGSEIQISEATAKKSIYG